MKKDVFISFSATEKFEEIDYSVKYLLRCAICATLDREGFDRPAEISVTLCSPEYIRGLNKEHRGIDKETDVLSFPLYETDELMSDILEPVASLGDIVISVPRAKAQAEEIGSYFKKELMFLAVHSTLHLLGYDHERSPEDDELQCRKQKEIINALFPD